MASWLSSLGFVRSPTFMTAMSNTAENFKRLNEVLTAHAKELSSQFINFQDFKHETASSMETTTNRFVIMSVIIGVLGGAVVYYITFIRTESKQGLTSMKKASDANFASMKKESDKALASIMEESKEAASQKLDKRQFEPFSKKMFDKLDEMSLSMTGMNSSMNDVKKEVREHKTIANHQGHQLAQYIGFQNAARQMLPQGGHQRMIDYSNQMPSYPVQTGYSHEFDDISTSDFPERGDTSKSRDSSPPAPKRASTFGRMTSPPRNILAEPSTQHELQSKFRSHSPEKSVAKVGGDQLVVPAGRTAAKTAAGSASSDALSPQAMRDLYSSPATTSQEPQAKMETAPGARDQTPGSARGDTDQEQAETLKSTSLKDDSKPAGEVVSGKAASTQRDPETATTVSARQDKGTTTSPETNIKPHQESRPSAGGQAKHKDIEASSTASSTDPFQAAREAAASGVMSFQGARGSGIAPAVLNARKSRAQAQGASREAQQVAESSKTPANAPKQPAAERKQKLSSMPSKWADVELTPQEQRSRDAAEKRQRKRQEALRDDTYWSETFAQKKP